MIARERVGSMIPHEFYILCEETAGIQSIISCVIEIWFMRKSNHRITHFFRGASGADKSVKR